MNDLRIVKGNPFATLIKVKAFKYDGTEIEDFELTDVSDLSIIVHVNRKIKHIPSDRYTIVNGNMLKIQWTEHEELGQYTLEVTGTYSGAPWRFLSKCSIFTIVNTTGDVHIPKSSIIDELLYLVPVEAKLLLSTIKNRIDYIGEDNYVYTWDDEQGEYTKTDIYVKGDLGILGIQGIRGEKGDKGDSGFSAYEIAVQNGFEGTEQEWLHSLESDTTEAIAAVNVNILNLCSRVVNLGCDKADIHDAIGSLLLSIDNSNYKITLSGSKTDGCSFTVNNPIDLPLESVVVSGTYCSDDKKVILTLQNGNTVEFSVADLVSGLLSEINANNKLDINYVTGYYPWIKNDILACAESYYCSDKILFSTPFGFIRTPQNAICLKNSCGLQISKIISSTEGSDVVWENSNNIEIPTIGLVATRLAIVQSQINSTLATKADKTYVDELVSYVSDGLDALGDLLLEGNCAYGVPSVYGTLFDLLDCAFGLNAKVNNLCSKAAGAVQFTFGMLCGRGGLHALDYPNGYPGLQRVITLTAGCSTGNCQIDNYMAVPWSVYNRQVIPLMGCFYEYKNCANNKIGILKCSVVDNSNSIDNKLISRTTRRPLSRLVTNRLTLNGVGCANELVLITDECSIVDHIISSNSPANSPTQNSDNSLYTGKKIESLINNAGLPYGEATGTPVLYGSTNYINDFIASVNGITSLHDGTVCILKNVSGYSGATSTYNSYTININNLGAKKVYYSSSDNVICGGFSNNYTNLFVYKEDLDYDEELKSYNGGWVVGFLLNTTYGIYSFGIGYAPCTTAAATVAKTATYSNYSLTNGGIVAVKFTNSVPANATLNINNRGAKPIYYKDSKITANIIKAGDVVTFIYSTSAVSGGAYILLAIDRWQNDITTLNSNISTLNTNKQNKLAACGALNISGDAISLRTTDMEQNENIETIITGCGEDVGWSCAGDAALATVNAIKQQLSKYVPYCGATKNINLGHKDIQAIGTIVSDEIAVTNITTNDFSYLRGDVYVKGDLHFAEDSRDVTDSGVTEYDNNAKIYIKGQEFNPYSKQQNRLRLEVFENATYKEKYRLNNLLKDRPLYESVDYQGNLVDDHTINLVKNLRFPHVYLYLDGKLNTDEKILVFYKKRRKSILKFNTSEGGTGFSDRKSDKLEFVLVPYLCMGRPTFFEPSGNNGYLDEYTNYNVILSHFYNNNVLTFLYDSSLAPVNKNRFFIKPNLGGTIMNYALRNAYSSLANDGINERSIIKGYELDIDGKNNQHFELREFGAPDMYTPVGEQLKHCFDYTNLALSIPYVFDMRNTDMYYQSAIQAFDAKSYANTMKYKTLFILNNPDVLCNTNLTILPTKATLRFLICSVDSTGKITSMRDYVDLDIRKRDRYPKNIISISGDDPDVGDIITHNKDGRNTNFTSYKDIHDWIERYFGIQVELTIALKNLHTYLYKTGIHYNKNSQYTSY